MSASRIELWEKELKVKGNARPPPPRVTPILTAESIRTTPGIGVARKKSTPKTMRDLTRRSSKWFCLEPIEVKEVKETPVDEDSVL